MYTVNSPYLLGRATELQAEFWYRESEIEAARSETSRAVDIFENLGATKYLRRSRAFLQRIEGEINGVVAYDFEGAFFGAALVPMLNSPLIPSPRATFGRCVV